MPESLPRVVEPVLAAAPATGEKTTALGAVFTRRWIVELALDLAGYTSDTDLADGVALEPACGHGAFVTVMVERLIASCRTYGHDIGGTSDALVAVDIDPEAVMETRARVRATLRSHGISAPVATRLAKRWVRESDFLRTARTLPAADWVVGNPPYVRIEDMADDDVRAYRDNWTTMSGRADLYVGFYEAALDRLNPDGRLSFICPDRWMRNRYGSALRAPPAGRRVVLARRMHRDARRGRLRGQGPRIPGNHSHPSGHTRLIPHGRSWGEL